MIASGGPRRPGRETNEMKVYKVDVGGREVHVQYAPAEAKRRGLTDAHLVGDSAAKAAKAPANKSAKAPANKAVPADGNLEK